MNDHADRMARKAQVEKVIDGALKGAIPEQYASMIRYPRIRPDGRVEVGNWSTAGLNDALADYAVPLKGGGWWFIWIGAASNSEDYVENSAALTRICDRRRWRFEFIPLYWGDDLIHGMIRRRFGLEPLPDEDEWYAQGGGE